MHTFWLGSKSLWLIVLLLLLLLQIFDAAESVSNKFVNVTGVFASLELAVTSCSCEDDDDDPSEDLEKIFSRLGNRLYIAVVAHISHFLFPIIVSNSFRRTAISHWHSRRAQRTKKTVTRETKNSKQSVYWPKWCSCIETMELSFSKRSEWRWFLWKVINACLNGYHSHLHEIESSFFCVV